MKREDFRPTGYITITNVCSMLVQVVREGGEYFVYSCFSYEGDKSSTVTKSVIKSNHSGNPYFCKGRTRYYLADIMKLK